MKNKQKTPIACPIDQYATHQRALARTALKAAIEFPELPIVEFGVGYYSTPILREIAAALNVRIISYSSSDVWAQRFTAERQNEELHIINPDEWPKLSIPECSMLFVDNEQSVINRFKHIERLQAYYKFLVFHDADIVPKRGLKLTNVPKHLQLELFKDQVPHTAVWSML